MPLSTKNATGISTIKEAAHFMHQSSFNGNSSLQIGAQKSEVDKQGYQSKERPMVKNGHGYIPADYSKSTVSSKAHNQQTPMHSFTAQANRVAQKVKQTQLSANSQQNVFKQHS